MERIGRGMNRGGFIGIVIALTLFSFFCCAGTAMSRTELSVQEIEGYYQEQERDLVKAARELLAEEGFAHSGVMLTRVVDSDGSREYTLTVHHGKIDKLDEDARKLLMEDLEKLVFEDTACTFRHEFLINQ